MEGRDTDIDTDRIKALVDATQARFEARFKIVENGPKPPEVIIPDCKAEKGSTSYPYLVICYPPRGESTSLSVGEILAGWEASAASQFSGDLASQVLLWRIPLEIEVMTDHDTCRTYFRAYGRAVSIPVASIVPPVA